MKAVLIILAIAVFGFVAFNIRGFVPSMAPVPTQVTQVTSTSSPPTTSSQNQTSLPLNIPNGFTLSIFAKDLGSPRVIAFDPVGTMIVSVPAQGKVMAISDKNTTVASGLNAPHGLAFSGNDLYIAETDKVSIFDYNSETKSATRRKKIIDLPGGGGHSTRTILIKDNKLYTSIGSSCNVCNEKDNRRAKVFVSNLDGSDFKEFAIGLRNSVFLTLHPTTGKIWATDMGRDLIGDDIPPDEINILEDGRDYGWPTCYGKNVHDTNFEKNGNCNGKTPSHIDLQAHSAPLGLAFVPKEWGNDYDGDVLVAYHGSWNRNTPTGYKIVRIHLDGNYQKTEDFITGWLSGGNATGRPVAIVFDKSGIAYISDDKAGVIYKLTKQ